jgi:outer membrane protein TolC
MVVLTVGNAYLLVLADESQVSSVEAQVATAKVSLDQAVANHQAGTAPLLDELRARVDYQTLDQQLIVAKTRWRRTSWRWPGPSGCRWRRSSRWRQGAVCGLRPAGCGATIQQALANRKDLAAMVEQTKAAVEQRKAATADRLPTLKVRRGLWRHWHVTLAHSHGTEDATGTLSVPVFKEFALRGEATTAQSQLDTQQAQLSDKSAQVDADVRDALLDIASTQKQVEVAKSSVDLASEALSEAQQRYANGVSDNLAVSQAEQSVAQANDQYVPASTGTMWPS